MDKFLKAIEMDKILCLLAERATLQDTKNICVELKCAESFSEAKNLLEMTEAALNLAQKEGLPKFSGAKNLDKILVRADKGGALSIKELLDVKSTINVIGGLVKYGESVASSPHHLTMAPLSEEGGTNGALTSAEGVGELGENIPPVISDDIAPCERMGQDLPLLLRGRGEGESGRTDEYQKISEEVLRCAKNDKRCLLGEIFGALILQKDLEKSLENAILSDDELKDSASPELAEIRRKILQKNDNAREKMQEVIARNRSSLQEFTVTKRNNRFVVPVKVEHKDKVKGVLHDVSASGGTLFIEPVEVANINNQIRELEGKEKAEVARILAELSVLVAEKCDEILASYRAVVELDLVFAKVNFALEIGAFKPKFNDDGIVRLAGAKHPLLVVKHGSPRQSADWHPLRRRRGQEGDGTSIAGKGSETTPPLAHPLKEGNGRVVPIDIEIGGEHESLIITGPNTGGKTVAVKTLALGCAMVKYGLFVTARDDSEICYFDEILASISEEQSIELSLSSFSAQVSNIAEILQRATEKSLVILDEPGSGTDPGEGATLAIAILENLLQKGAKVAITSHYAELKAYAMLHENILTYGAEFDVDTLAPTYKLIKGVPSGSNAFLIAKRLGISKEIIESAKKNLGGTDRKVHNILSKITKKSGEIEKMHEDIAQDLRRSEADKSAAAKELEKAENVAKKMIDEAKSKAQDLIDRTRIESEVILKNLKKAEQERGFESARAEYKKKMKEAEKEVGAAKSAQNTAYKLPRDLREGDGVKLFDIDKKGTVISVKGDGVRVQVGLMKMDTKISNIRLVEEKSTFNGEKIKSHTSTKVERNAAMEVDVRGMYANDAVDEVDKYIDSAVLSGFDVVTIVHGKGSGVLRKAVHDYLKGHRQVKSYRVGKYGEGEEGVTIVELR